MENQNIKFRAGKLTVTLIGDVATISLSNVTFKIDKKYLGEVIKLKWHRHQVVHKPTGTTKTYVAHSSSTKTVLLHRFILQLQGVDVSDRKKVIDHIDGDGTNCLSSNLRLVPRSLNSANRFTKTSSESGLANIQKKGSKYYVMMSKDGQNIIIPGGFNSVSEAIEARNALGVALYGESVFKRVDNLDCVIQVGLETVEAQDFQARAA